MHLFATASVAVATGTSAAVASTVTAAAATAVGASVETGLALMLHPSFGCGQQGPAGESHLAGLLVNLEELDIHLVAYLKYILHLVDLLVVELGNVQQAFLAGQNLHESTELEDRHYLAVVCLTDLRHSGDSLDAGQSGVHGLLVLTEDVDDALVTLLSDGDGGAGSLLYLLDNLAAGADNSSDKLGRYGDLHDTGNVGTVVGAGLGDGLEHLAHDVA